MLAALATTALLGASSASASNTALCKSNESGALACALANQLTTMHGVATDLVFLTSAVNILCTSSLIKASLLGLGAPQVAHLSELTWTGCKTEGGTACSVTNHALGLILFLKTAANLGSAEMHGTTFEIECGFFIDCTYEEPWVFHLLGASALGPNGPSSNGGMTDGKEGSGGGGADDGEICPHTTVWDTFYESLVPLYVKT